MNPTTLEQAYDEAAFGGKAVSLGRALRSGLRVPDGIALDVALVDAVAAGSAPAGLYEAIVDRLGDGPFAVRSSAVGEDSDGASFAGQHVTRLNVRGAGSLVAAIRAVWESGRTESALGYRRRLGLDDAPRVAVVVQRMIAADVAGVLFTRNPVDGADERMIEASWGLGEAVVAGLVTPDRWRMRRGGEVVEEEAGEKDVEIVPNGDGVEERPVEGSRVHALCLDAAGIAALEELATRCEGYFDGASDIEWGFERKVLYLLQRRAITR